MRSGWPERVFRAGTCHVVSARMKNRSLCNERLLRSFRRRANGAAGSLAFIGLTALDRIGPAVAAAFAARDLTLPDADGIRMQ